MGQVKSKPDVIENREFRYDCFESGNVLHGKKKNHLPSMGWNSWNAFGSGNTEALTKAMADKFIELELDKAGYEYIVLDDGCYKPERVDGRLSNEEVKFPSGFKALSDYIHGKGLKFGMYNDIGTNLCAGALVGTCGFEVEDTQSYIDWGVDFLKVDNCYYLWDNATFSDAANARFVYAPNIKAIKLMGLNGNEQELSAVNDGVLTGRGAVKTEEYVTNIGTFDGTGPDNSPLGAQSGELCFAVCAPESGQYELKVLYATGKEVGTGTWLQIAVGEGKDANVIFDDELPETGSLTDFSWSDSFFVNLTKGENVIRLMNHRRQENTLCSYATLIDGLNKADPDHDVFFSICEWGKTEPQNWGYKVGDSWRILNDITFQVGADGDPGNANWSGDYTTGVTNQYNKAVIMDEFSGLNKGWNDPDMMMIGMNGLNEVQCRTHMVMWCMMNSPLMLGMDLRRVNKGDWIHKIITNDRLISLNQDALGIQAKRIYASGCKEPDNTYIRDNNRVDVLAKPLADGSVALSFVNVNNEEMAEGYAVTKGMICKYIGTKLADEEAFLKASSFVVEDLFTGEKTVNDTGLFEVNKLAACDNVTLKITPVKQI